MATTLSKEDYLKRYLSGGDDEQKKKKKKKKPQGVVKARRNIVIHDDDIDVKKLTPDQKDETADQLNVDEAPLVADFIDERPAEEVQLEQFRQSKKWKLMNKDKDEAASSGSGLASDSPHRGRHHQHDSDQSPPRKHRTKDALGKNKSKANHRNRHDSDSDMSPPRSRRHDSDLDMSPPRRTRHDSDSDIAPPRRARHDSDSDISPPRKSRHDSDSDMSPPRRTQKHSSKQKQRRRDSDSDLSPPRKNARKGDQSPPRRSRHLQGSRSARGIDARKRRDSGSDLSPPRRKRRGSDSDLSPPRRKRGGSDSDLSPPRRKDKQGKVKLDKMASGAKAGLQNARTMRQENEATRRRNADMFSHMNEELSGRNAETVFRERSSGKTRDLKMEKIKKREEDQKKAEEDEKFMEWGKGVVQKKQKESTLQEHIHEMAKPMARYRDDKDLDALLKEQDRDGDPMLAFMKKKQAKQNEALGIKEKPKYKGPKPPPNRFNIMPGYRWDGVDRSNGFEKKMFMRNADKKAMSMIAYKWSIEDM